MFPQESTKMPISKLRFNTLPRVGERSLSVFVTCTRGKDQVMRKPNSDAVLVISIFHACHAISQMNCLRHILKKIVAGLLHVIVNFRTFSNDFRQARIYSYECFKDREKMFKVR